MIFHSKAVTNHLVTEVSITNIKSRSITPGFGTSGRILYFNNFYIELRWIENPDVFRKAILLHYKNNKAMLAKIKMGVVLICNNINDSVLPFDTSNFCLDMMLPGG